MYRREERGCASVWGSAQVVGLGVKVVVGPTESDLQQLRSRRAWRLLSDGGGSWRKLRELAFVDQP